MKGKPEKNLRYRLGSMGPGWYIDFSMKIGGRKRRIRAFGGYSREAAREELSRRRLEKLDEKRGLRKPTENIALKDFLDEFIAGCEANGKRSVGRDRTLAAHLNNYFQNKNLNEITASGVEGYKVHRRAQRLKKAGDRLVPVSAGTVNRELSLLREALYAAVAQGRLTDYPLPKRRLLLKEPDFKFRVLTRAEAKALLAAAPEYLKPIILTLLSTGMRKGEVLGLKWDSVDFHRGFIQIAAQDAKSGKARSVPMSPALFETLRDLHVAGASAEHVFINPKTGRRLKDFKRSFATACRGTGIKCRIHDLRHTFASWAVETGCDLVTLKDILGHSSLAMVLRYAHPGEETRRRAVAKVGEFFDQRRQKGDKVKVPRLASLSKMAH